MSAVDELYNSVRKLDPRYVKDIENRLKFLFGDICNNLKDKKTSYLTAEDKTEFSKLKERCQSQNDNKNLLEDVLMRIEKESTIYEQVAYVSSEFVRAKTNQSQSLAIASPIY